MKELEHWTCEQGRAKERRGKRYTRKVERGKQTPPFRPQAWPRPAILSLTRVRILFPQASNQSENQVADDDYQESEYEEFCDIPMG